MEISFFAMGCPCSIQVCGSDDAAAACEAAWTEVRRLERRYSRYDPHSHLSAINHVAEVGESMVVDEETADLIDIAFDAHQMSDGLFDVTSGLLRQVWNDDVSRLPTAEDLGALLPRIGLAKVRWRRPRLEFSVPGMELDFGGIVKEYAADRAAFALSAAGARGGYVSLGGDLAVLGPQDDGAPWRIGVSDPRTPSRASATLLIERGGVATSGLYERFWEIDGKRYGHVLDPQTGWPIEALPSITVVADTCLEAGLSSTIALLRGERGPRWLESRAASYLYLDRTGALRGSLLDPPGREDAIR